MKEDRLGLWLLSLVGSMILSACGTAGSDALTRQTTVQPTAWSEPTQDAYSSCYSWQEAGYLDGKVACIIGRVRQVTNEVDEYSGQTISRAEFGARGRDFALLGIDYDISRWEGQCVVVVGELLDRSSAIAEGFHPAPSMFSEGRWDDRGFQIEVAPDPLCAQSSWQGLDLGAGNPPHANAFMDCADSASSTGQDVTCVIRRAYCSYEASESGGPTFCNDAPYPGHNFTLVAWGQDWSDYDGKCLVVTGQVSLYRGKPQVEARSRSQIAACP
jgi:hypothetical protein